MRQPGNEIRGVIEEARQKIKALAAPATAEDGASRTRENWCDVEVLMRLEREDFVRGAYRALLRREPEWFGLEQWVKALQSNAVTKLQIIRGIAESPEGKHNNVRLVGLDWRAYAESKPAGAGEELPPMVVQDRRDFECFDGRRLIEALFRVVLGREPEESGVAPWLEILQSGRLSKREVITAFLNTEEGRRRWVFIRGVPETDRSVELLLDRDTLLDRKVQALESELCRAVTALERLTLEIRERAEEQSQLLERARLEWEQARATWARDLASKGQEA